MRSLLSLLKEEESFIEEIEWAEREIEMRQAVIDVAPDCSDIFEELCASKKYLERCEKELETFRKEVIGKHLSEYYGVKEV